MSWNPPTCKPLPSWVPRRGQGLYLINDSSSSNIQVSDLGVAHQPFREAHKKTVRLDLCHGAGIFLGESCHNRVARVANGISRGIRLGRNAPAVDADETDLLAGLKPGSRCGGVAINEGNR